MPVKQTNFFFLFLVFLFFIQSASAQILQKQLQQKISSLADGYRATIGVCVSNFKSAENFALNEDKHFAMQSVYKFHLALAILHQVDEGKLQLEEMITLRKENVDLDPHSPMRDVHRGQDISVSIKELLRYTVSLSDNNACDALFELAGGTKAVDDYMHSIQVKEVSIAATEREMKKEWSVQFTNWSTPRSATALLRLFHSGSILNKSSHDFLWELMINSVKTDRLKGQLPESVMVAHKPGTSGRNAAGVRAACNDIGIVVLPDGTPFYISVFINNSKESDEVNAKIIADITKLCYDFYCGK